jgi:hypothetical protein
MIRNSLMMWTFTLQYTINLLINTRDVPIDTKKLTFTMNATSVGNEVNASNNYKELVLPVGLKADMTITG